MRIALVSHCAPPEGLGGVERYTHTLAEALAASGHRVLWVAAAESGRGPALRKFEQSGVSHVRVSHGGASGLLTAVYNKDTTQACVAELRSFQPEVVHLQHLLGFSPGLIPRAAELGARVFLSVHDHFLLCPRLHLLDQDGTPCRGPGLAVCARCLGRGRDPLRRTLAPLFLRWYRHTLGRAFRSLEALLLPAEHLAAPLAAAFPGVGLRRLDHFAPSGVSPRTRPPGKRPRLLYAGGPQVHKGFDVLRQALGLLRKRDFELLTPGLDLGLPGCRALPLLDFEAMDELWKTIDGLLVPSLWPEIGPLVVLEALARGVPYLGSDLGGIAELHGRHQGGYLVHPGDAEALADGISHLVETLAAGTLPECRGTLPMLGDHLRRLEGIYRAGGPAKR